MKTTATRNATLSLTFDFSDAKARVRSIEAYSKELAAGVARMGITYQELARLSNISASTIGHHAAADVRNPTIRTVFSILFAIGWEEVTITKGDEQITRQQGVA